MVQWLKSSVLDALGFGDASPSPTRHKRRATSDGKRRHRAARNDTAACRSAQYVTYPGVKSTFYRPQTKGQPRKTPLRDASVHVVPTAAKVAAHSDDESGLSTGTDLPAGFGTDEDVFEPVVPKINISTTKASAKKGKDEWLTDPIGKAHDVASRGMNKRPLIRNDTQAPEYALRDIEIRRLIQHEVQEPEYALRDTEIRDGILELRNTMSGFSSRLFSFKIDAPKTDLNASFFGNFSAETAKIIGCVASGGPGGVEGWKEMFSDMDKRKALVCAIVGNVIVEQVFQHMFFGGIPVDVMDVVKLQDVHMDEDGFDRNVHYATYIRRILEANGNGRLDLPGNFSNHVNLVVGALYTHLAPIRNLNRKLNTNSLIRGLHEIVTHAGILSLTMRIDPHTVYHFEPVFKEDTFIPKRMECFNEKDMEQTNPRTDDDHELLSDTEKARRVRLSSAEKRRAKNDDPLTQITIIDGVTAYRKGGWETALSEVLKVKYERTEFRDQGVRARNLVPGWVFCRWGRAREFKDGKSADVAKEHGVAWNGGFKEFADVEGVVDCIGIERAKREKNREAVLAKEDGKGKAPVERRVPRETVDSSKGKARMAEADIQAQLLE